MLLCPLCVALVPLGRCEVGPAEAAGGQVLAIVSHDKQKCVVGLDDPAVEVPHEDADDVCLDQAAHPTFLFAQYGLRLAADRHVLGELLTHLAQITISDLQVMRQRVERRDYPQPLVLVPEWPAAQTQLQRRVINAVAADIGCNRG